MKKLLNCLQNQKKFKYKYFLGISLLNCNNNKYKNYWKNYGSKNFMKMILNCQFKKKLNYKMKMTNSDRN